MCEAHTPEFLWNLIPQDLWELRLLWFFYVWILYWKITIVQKNNTSWYQTNSTCVTFGDMKIQKCFHDPWKYICIDKSVKWHQPKTVLAIIETFLKFRHLFFIVLLRFYAILGGMETAVDSWKIACLGFFGEKSGMLAGLFVK